MLTISTVSSPLAETLNFVKLLVLYLYYRETERYVWRKAHFFRLTDVRRNISGELATCTTARLVEKVRRHTT